MHWLSFPCSNSGKNGNSWVPIPVTAPETGPSTATKMTVPSTAEEKICKKNDVKARSLLLMALPNEHQLTFDQYVDAQSMFAAIKARFGGNEATKKTQKALLKQQYENFNASSSESLDSIFNRLQKLVSRLAILGVVTPPEDLNVKFLRSLPLLNGIHMCTKEYNTVNLKLVLRLPTKVNTANTGYDKSKLMFTAIKCDIFPEKYRAPRSKDQKIGNKRKKFRQTWLLWHSQILREEEPKKARENNDAPIIEDWVSDDEDEVEPIPKVEKKTVIPTATKKEFVKPEKPVRRSVSCPKTSHPSAHKHMAPKAVLMKTGLKSVNTARPVNTVRQNVNTVRARGFNVVKPSACWVWRPIKPNGASLSNSSQLNDKGLCLIGCSTEHEHGNIAHLSDFKDFDGAMLLLGGAYGCRITDNKFGDKFDERSDGRFSLLDIPLSSKAFSAIYEGILIRTYIHGLFACSPPLSKEEPKRVYKALSDPAWVEAMQEELLQFKLQKVWILVDLPKGSVGFHQVIDFLNRSHICYALTKKPDVYISFIKQFWRSAEATTDDNGELDDQDGITSIPNSEIFEQLALMGYHTDSDKLTFQKGAFSPQWRFLIHNILHCLSPKKTAWEQFSSNIATAVICLATNRKYNFSRMIFEHMVSNISSPHKFLMYPRFIQICLDMQRKQLQQHSRTYPVPSLSIKVFNNMKRPTKGYSGQEVALFPTMLDVSEPSTSPSRITSSPSHSHEPSPSPEPSFEHSPDHTTAAPTQPSPTQPSPTQPSTGAEHHFPTPHDSPLHAVHSHGSDEGSLKLNELTNLVTKLSERIGVLEDDLRKTKKTYSSAFTKLILRVKKLEARVKIGKARKRAKVVLSEDDEDVEDDSSKQGRKLSDAEVQEKASTETEPIIQEVTPTEVIQDQESSEKGCLCFVESRSAEVVLWCTKTTVCSSVQFEIYSLKYEIGYSMVQYLRSAEASTNDNGEFQITATIDGHSMSIIEENMQRNQLQQHSRTSHVPSLSIKVFNSMKRPTKGYSGQEVALFPTILDVSEPSTSPSRITSLPSHSHEPSTSPEPLIEHTPAPSFDHLPDHTTAAPTQPSLTQPSTRAEHHFSTPCELPLQVIHSHGSDEGSLKLNELTNLVTKLSERIRVL
ncbi:hypothetical protein Tco_1369482 [Tanacetum coccineum]